MVDVTWYNWSEWGLQPKTSKRSFFVDMTLPGMLYRTCCRKTSRFAWKELPVVPVVLFLQQILWDTPELWSVGNLFFWCTKPNFGEYLSISKHHESCILVGGWATPLKNRSSSIGMISNPISGKIIQMATKPPTRHVLLIVFKWGFPKIGVPPVIIYFRWGFSRSQKPSILGYPHDSGNPQMNFKSGSSKRPDRPHLLCVTSLCSWVGRCKSILVVIQLEIQSR